MPRFRQPIRSRNSNRSWSGTVAFGVIAVPAASAVLLGSFSVADTAFDQTVLRSVGMIGVQSDQAAASELQLGAFSMAIVTDSALAVGVTAIPDPVTEADDDIWFVYQPFMQALQFADATGFTAQRMTQYPFDSKAKRKMDAGKSIVLIVANSHATHAFEFMFAVRILVMSRGSG